MNKTTKIALTLVTAIVMVLTINVFAAQISSADAQAKVDDLTTQLENAKKDVIAKEEAEAIANEEYAKAAEQATILETKKNEINKDSRVVAAQERLDKAEEVLNAAQARLDKVNAEIEAGMAAVEAAQQDPTNVEKQKAAEEAWAKNDEWIAELDEAQRSLNTIKTDDEIGYAKSNLKKVTKDVTTEITEQYNAAVTALEKATKKAKEATEALNAAVKTRSDVKDALELANEELDAALMAENKKPETKPEIQPGEDTEVGNKVEPENTTEEPKKEETKEETKKETVKVSNTPATGAQIAVAGLVLVASAGTAVASLKIKKNK